MASPNTVISKSKNRQLAVLRNVGLFVNLCLRELTAAPPPVGWNRQIKIKVQTRHRFYLTAKFFTG
jgi:hypothetical protein